MLSLHVESIKQDCAQPTQRDAAQPTGVGKGEIVGAAVVDGAAPSDSVDVPLGVEDGVGEGEGGANAASQPPSGLHSSHQPPVFAQ